MHTLIEDGIAKAAQGLTTLEAVLTVVKLDGGSASNESDDNAAQNHASGSREETSVTDVKSAPVLLENQAADTSTKKGRILIVEDDRTIISVVKYFLELEGFEVVVAANGQLGFQSAKSELPLVIVTDCNMPVMDGVAMVKALRADAQTRDVCILMLTSGSRVEDETRALAAGADDYLVKPVEPRRLVARIKTLLARSQRGQLASAK